MSLFRKKVDETPAAEMIEVFKLTEKDYTLYSSTSYDRTVGYFTTCEKAFAFGRKNGRVCKVTLIKVGDKLYEWHGAEAVTVNE